MQFFPPSPASPTPSPNFSTPCGSPLAAATVAPGIGFGTPCGTPTAASGFVTPREGPTAAGAGQGRSDMTPPGSPLSFALPPAVELASSSSTSTPGVAGLREIVATLNIFTGCVEKYPEDAVASAVASRARGPLAQATELCVRGVLDELQAAVSTNNLISLLSAVWFVREFCEASSSARELVRRIGGRELLGPVLLNPQADDRLIKEAVKLLHCLQGCQGLFDSFAHMAQVGPRVVTQLLWHLREQGRHNWKELGALPAVPLMSMAIASIRTYPEDWSVHEAAMALISDLLGSVEYRSAFASVGGWPYILMALEAQRDNVEVQQRGLQILCELQRGGAWGADYSERVGLLIMCTLELHHEWDNIRKWGLWLLLEIGGLRLLLCILERMGESSKVGAEVLRTLRRVEWGQTEGAGMEIIPDFVRVVGLGVCGSALGKGDTYTLEIVLELLVEAGRGAALFAQNLSPPVANARSDAVQMVLEVMRQHFSDERMAVCCLEVVRVFQAAPEGSACRQQISEGLLGGSGPGMLRTLAEKHASHQEVSSRVLWVEGVLRGPAAVVTLMEQFAGNSNVEVAGVKTLGQLYDEFEDLDAPASEARVPAVQAITKVMQARPQDAHLLSHACFALYALAAHGAEARDGSYNPQHVRYSLQVAWKINAPLADELDKQGYRSQARYLRQELCRLETEGLKAAGLPLMPELRADALRIGVATAQCQALIRDGRRGELEDPELAESLRLALVDLGVMGQPGCIVEALQAWMQPVARGAANAAVDLSRLGMQAELQQVGLDKVALAVREEWQKAGRWSDPHMADFVTSLNLAVDWMTSVRT